jgi:Nif-specific regulatory protein
MKPFTVCSRRSIVQIAAKGGLTGERVSLFTCRRDSMPLYTYLTMTVGSRAGQSFRLSANQEFRLGRGLECDLQVMDALSSRVHATIRDDRGMWLVRDEQSRNGTFVNGQRINEETRLGDGHVIRIGSCELVFHQSEQPPTADGGFDPHVTQTIIRDERIGVRESAVLAVSAMQDMEQTQDLLLLYQLSIRLLGTVSTDEVLRASLELLLARTSASLVGFLWLSEDGHLKPKLVLPDQGGRPPLLSESLTRLVCEEGHAVWVANQRSVRATDSLRHCSDALCIPLVTEGHPMGAIHAYLDKGRFRQSQFDFAISLANITAVALARARMDASLQTDLDRLKERACGFDELIGESPPISELKAKIQRLGRAGGPVLIRGESGAGKELVARAVVRVSSRSDRPMLSVNCAAIPENLMESQLFGHRAGAFTGAERDHRGLFQQADLGTLFLDEIGELTLAGQSKLLRILEGHPFLPVGGTEEVQVDVRVIAATNQNLPAKVREKSFREDLYYRLNVFELFIPPLRERGKDVALLVDYFLEHFKRLHGRPNLELSAAARSRLLAYQWPGNVRQLRNVMDSAVVLAADPRIEPVDLSLQDASSSELETLNLDLWERKLIREALLRTGHNVPEAAQMLGIGRATLYRKLDEYGIGGKREASKEKAREAP